MNDLSSTLFIYFGAGMFLQGVIATFPKFKTAKFIIITFISALIAYAISRGDADFLFEHGVLAAAIIYSFAMGFAFKKELLGYINERYLLFMNTIFLYVLLTTRMFTELSTETIALLAVASLTVFVHAFWHRTLTRGWKIFSYIWLLFMTLWVMFYFFFKAFEQAHTPLTILLTGMGFFIVTTHVWILMEFMILSKSDFKKHGDLLAKRFSDEQSRPLESLLIIGVTGGLLAGNHYLHLLPPALLINILLIALPKLAAVGKKQVIP